MRLENFGELPFKQRDRTFGNWVVSDVGHRNGDLNGGDRLVRALFYHGTHMLTISRNILGGDWVVDEAHIGWGSASEQKGVNRILKGAGITTHYYRRNGGNPRYEVSVETLVA